MQTSKLLAVAGAVALGAGLLSVRADDTPVQAAARAALEQKMNEVGTQPARTPPVSVAATNAVVAQPRQSKMPATPAAKPAAAPAASPAHPANPAATPTGDTAAQAAARAALEQALNEPETSSSCLLYTSPSPRDLSTSRMPSSA